MGRVTDILDIALPEGVIDSFGLIAAYCQCVTPPQACDLLRRAAIERVDLRAPVLRKVCSDIETSYAPCHENLVKRILSALSTSDSRGRQSLGYCLSTLAVHLPATERDAILKSFLSSQYITIRRRAYKALASHPSPALQEAIQVAWTRFLDPECAWLIVKTFPVAFLAEHRSALASVFSEGWQFSRLYLRIAESDISVLGELKQINEISYCYVMAKLRQPIPLNDAQEIVNRTSLNDSFGLVVWSFGHLGQWQALKYVESQLSAIQDRKLAAMRARHGI